LDFLLDFFVSGLSPVDGLENLMNARSQTNNNSIIHFRLALVQSSSAAASPPFFDFFFLVLPIFPVLMTDLGAY